MDWTVVAAVAFGLVIAVVTTPVGVSGAVFLLPVQLSILGVPSPAVTPTNLLFNVVAVPGALLRYRRASSLRTPLTGRLLVGTLPGVVIGAVVRVYLVPGGTVFRVLLSVFLLPLGVWLLVRDRVTAQGVGRRLPGVAVTGLAFGAGLIGGVYGIGGGSLLAPILAATGYLITEVAPAALLSTFVTSCVGAGTYIAIELSGRHEATPDWRLGLACGFGGLVGGYLGASLQPRLPAGRLGPLLGAIAVGLSVAYLVVALH
jgi:uncharacterized protein